MNHSTFSPCRTEKPAVWTEAALAKSLALSLRKGWCVQRQAHRELLFELAGVQGIADLVEATIGDYPTTLRLADLADSLASPTKALILAVLKYRTPRRKDYIAKVTGLSNRTLEFHIRQLKQVGLVEVQGSSNVALSCHLSWSMVDMAAYEVKLHNWRRALQQAINYRSFARSVCIVMPTSSVHNAKKLESAFHANGIGLTGIDEKGNTNVEIRSKKHRRPTSRRLYYMAVGVVLNKLLVKENKLHDYLGFESL